jgi:hypothetical protein
VGGGGRVGDGALGIAQVGGNGDHASGIDHLPCLRLATLQLEREDAAVAALLRGGQRVLRVRGEARVVYPLYPPLLLQPLGQGLGIRRMRAQT